MVIAKHTELLGYPGPWKDKEEQGSWLRDAQRRKRKLSRFMVLYRQSPDEGSVHLGLRAGGRAWGSRRRTGLGAVVHTCDPSIRKTKAAGLGRPGLLARLSLAKQRQGM